MYKHVGEVCSLYLFFPCCSDMNNRSIAWWLRENGLSQYTKILERGYYGLEVCAHSLNASVFFFAMVSNLQKKHYLIIPV